MMKETAAEPRLFGPRFLFRFAVPVRRRAPLWDQSRPDPGPRYQLPDLAGLDAARRFAVVRMAWGAEGLVVGVQVRGKTQPLWCRESRLEDSDGLQVWIDTRATRNIHRATRFCHRFVFLPAGGGSGHQQPVADQLLIHRARENAQPVRPGQLQMVRRATRGGYRLAALIPAAALTGFDPADQPRLGFNYAVYDRELGLQTFSTSCEFPYDEDPSTWATLDLIP